MDPTLAMILLFGGAALSVGFLLFAFFWIWRDDRRRPYFDKLVARRNAIDWKIKKLESERVEIERNMEIFKPKEGAKRNRTEEI